MGHFVNKKVLFMADHLSALQALLSSKQLAIAPNLIQKEIKSETIFPSHPQNATFIKTAFDRLATPKCEICEESHESTDLHLELLFSTDFSLMKTTATRALFACQQCRQLIRPNLLINTILNDHETTAHLISIFSQVNKLDESQSQKLLQEIVSLSIATQVITSQMDTIKVCAPNGEEISEDMDPVALLDQLMPKQKRIKRKGEAVQNADSPKSKKGKKSKSKKGKSSNREE
eukprot:c4802_g1_i1.p1 GENE.c4802_g1_i1~~c4802_g1_i1.p1  ORF type:complete len:232 (+),score=29.58 c4802_g1_i1:1-696(+)